MSRKKLRFLFVQPHFNRRYVKFFPVYEPLHGLLLAATVKDLADSVLFDRRFDSDKNLERLIRDFEPDIVGATTHTAGELDNVLSIFSRVKRLRPDAVTIVGGQHATLLPEDFYRPEVDLVCIGPGEETFREVVETLSSKGDFSAIAGLAVRQGNDHQLTQPRTLRSGTFSWPQFDRSLLPRRYRRYYSFTFERRATVYTITTSGCPYRCNFCSLWAAARGTYRRREPAEIVEDIASQPQSYVHLTDDNTFANESHALEIYRLLKQRDLRKKILAYARSDTIIRKPHLFEKWREVGLGALVVGMEAVSDKHLAALNKRSCVDVNVQAQQVLDRLGLENWAHFVVMPDFTREDFAELWEFVDRLNLTYPVFVPYTPVPGTPLFFEAKQKGLLSTYDYGFYNLQYMVMKTTMPKAEWYRQMLALYAKSCSPGTLWRRRVSPSFHWRPALGRALAMGPVGWRLRPHIAEQLASEQTVRYADIEHELPPSLRRDYQPNAYYSAPQMLRRPHAVAPELPQAPQPVAALSVAESAPSAAVARLSPAQGD